MSVELREGGFCHQTLALAMRHDPAGDLRARPGKYQRRQRSYSAWRRCAFRLASFGQKVREQLLKEIAPATERVVVIYNPDTAPYAIFLPVMEVVAPQTGLMLIPGPVRDKAGIENAIGEVAGVAGSGLMITPDVFTTLHRKTIFELATRGRMPTMCPLGAYTGPAA
jgi:hypothetical protein